MRLYPQLPLFNLVQLFKMFESPNEENALEILCKVVYRLSLDVYCNLSLLPKYLKFMVAQIKLRNIIFERNWKSNYFLIKSNRNTLLNINRLKVIEKLEVSIKSLNGNLGGATSRIFSIFSGNDNTKAISSNER